MQNNEYELYLQHHGVKGMKWGVRKKRQTASVADVAAAKKKRDDAREVLETSRARKKSAQGAYNAAMGNATRTQNTFGKRGKAAWDEAYRTADESRKADKKFANDKKAYRKAQKDYKDAKRALDKIEKQQYKDFVKTRSKEILAGESALGKIWDVYTGGHKTQARLEYNLRDIPD